MAIHHLPDPGRASRADHEQPVAGNRRRTLSRHNHARNITVIVESARSAAGGDRFRALMSRATQILLDFSQQAVAMRYQIDGIWETMPPLPRETGDPMLAALNSYRLAKGESRVSAGLPMSQHAAVIGSSVTSSVAIESRCMLIVPEALNAE